MYGLDIESDELIEIQDDDAVAGITGGISPWMSTMRLAATMGADEKTLINLQPQTPRW